MATRRYRPIESIYSPRYYRAGTERCYRGHVGRIGPVTKQCFACHQEYLQLSQEGNWKGDFPKQGVLR